jgi:hypothetical protein
LQISGTPAAAGTYTFTLQATDSAAATATAVFTITVTTVTAVTPSSPWKFLIAAPQPDGTYLAELAQAQSRTLTLRAGPGNYHEAGADIDGYSAEAIPAAELQSDLQVLYSGAVVFCGRVGGIADTLDAPSYRMQVTAMDYRQVLRRRSLAYGGGPNFNADTDIADMAWDLIQAGFGGQQGVQKYPGGNLGIARGIGAAGLSITAQRNYNRQTFAGQAIDDLCGLTPGADWDITPYGAADLRLDMWSPARGADNGVVLSWGDGAVASIARTTDPSAYANSVFVTGQALTNTPSGGSAGALDAADIATRTEGRWDQIIGTQHTHQGSLDKAAAWYLNDQQVISPSYTITLHPGAWGGPDHIWIGDTVTVWVNAGRLTVEDPLPVTEMSFDINSSGLETLTMTVGRVPFRIHQHIPKILRRLRYLETL